MAHVATITIDHTKVPGDLTDYVGLIVPDGSAGYAALYALCLEGGGDIRLFKSDDTTEIAREIVSFSVSAETGEIHYKYSGTLSSSVDTAIHVYADGSSADYAVTATYGRNAVWSGCILRYNLKVDANDSTGTYNGTATSITYNTDTGASLNGTNSKIDIPTISGVTNELYVNLWAKADTVSGVRNMFFTGNAANNRNLDVTNNSTYPRVGWFDGGFKQVADTGLSFGTTSFRMVTGTKNGANLEIFIDGATEDSRNDLSTLNIGLDRWGVGYIRTNNASFFDGDIKWISVRSSVPTANWITTEYNNQNDNGSFWEATDAGGGAAAQAARRGAVMMM